MVDGACSGNPGISEYQITNAYGNPNYIKYKKYQEGTNNLMEFLALVEGMRYLKDNNLIEKSSIWSDSVTAISWVKKKKVNTSLKMDIILENDINEALRFLKDINLDNFQIKKWKTKEWGEIPADFGRK